MSVYLVVNTAPPAPLAEVIVAVYENCRGECYEPVVFEAVP